MTTLAIDIGGTKFSAGVFVDDKLVMRESRATDRAGGRDWMLDQIAWLGRQWKRTFQFDRCGIGFGGPVQYDVQRVAMSTHVEGWRDFGLPAYISNVLGIPAIMDNDANVGGLGEACYGAGMELQPGHLLFYMTLSTGIGGGIILDDSIYRGCDSYAGEIGHISIRPEGPECLCGARGCFERMCCGLWLERDYGRPAKELLADPAFAGRYAADVALGLKSCIMLLNPAKIVVGGGIAKAGDALFSPLRAELGRQITAWSRARIDVVPAALGDDNVLWGALALADSVSL
ncbi:MAG: ROK family protein [Bryobacteraceae bacterium]